MRVFRLKNRLAAQVYIDKLLWGFQYDFSVVFVEGREELQVDIIVPYDTPAEAFPKEQWLAK